MRKPPDDPGGGLGATRFMLGGWTAPEITGTAPLSEPLQPGQPLRLRCGSKHLHALGTRPLAEFLDEIGLEHSGSAAIAR